MSNPTYLIVKTEEANPGEVQPLPADQRASASRVWMEVGRDLDSGLPLMR